MPFGLDYDGLTVVKYLGYALPGKSGADAAALVGKVVWSGEHYRKTQWANADRDTWNQVWNDRATLTYSDRPEIPLDWSYRDLVPTPVGGDPTRFDVDCDLDVAQVEIWLDSTPMREVLGAPVWNAWRRVSSSRIELGVDVDLVDQWLWARVWIDSGEL